MYYRTARPIPPKEELFVSYGKEYAEQLGITQEAFYGPDKSHIKNQVFRCSKCQITYASPLNRDDHEVKCRGPRVKAVRVAVDHTALDVDKLATMVDGRIRYKCELCEFNTQNRGNMTRHLRAHSGEKPFECEFCGRRFVVKSKLAEHERIHSDVKPFKCTECDYTCNFTSDLKVHRMKHTGETLYACDLCDYKTGWSGDLARHVRSHSGERPFRCPKCPNSYTRKSYLEDHLRTHYGEEVNCTLCSYTTITRSSLKKHMERRHKKVSQLSNQASVIKESIGKQPTNLRNEFEPDVQRRNLFKFNCSLCSYNTTSNDSFEEHMEKEHTQESKTFNQSRAPEKHTGESKSQTYNKTSVHEQAGKSPSLNSQSECTASKNIHLTNGTRSHSAQKPFQCPTCPLSYTCKSSLEDHLRTHSGEKLSCTLCSFTTTSMNSLRKHKKGKHKEKSQPTNESIAMKLDGESPSSSPQKGLEPTKSTNLKQDAPSKREVKRHQCPECSSSYTDKKRLLEHMKCHTGEKLTCQHCSYSTTWGDSMVRHMKSKHSGENLPTP